MIVDKKFTVAWFTGVVEKCRQERGAHYVYAFLEQYLADAVSEAKPEKPCYPVGVSILVLNQRGQLALGMRAKGTKGEGLLSTPGGRIEESEDMFEAASRELEEETGVKKPASKFKPVGYMEHKRFGEHYFMFYLMVRHDGSLENREPHKSGPWEWYNLSAIDFSKTTEPRDIVIAALRARIAALRARE